MCLVHFLFINIWIISSIRKRMANTHPLHSLCVLSLLGLFFLKNKKLPTSYEETILMSEHYNREKEEDQKLIEAGKGFDRDIVNGILKNSITNIIKLKTTRIDVIVNSHTITTTLSDRGVDIYRIREENKDFEG